MCKDSKAWSAWHIPGTRSRAECLKYLVGGSWLGWKGTLSWSQRSSVGSSELGCLLKAEERLWCGILTREGQIWLAFQRGTSGSAQASSSLSYTLASLLQLSLREKPQPHFSHGYCPGQDQRGFPKTPNIPRTKKDFPGRYWFQELKLCYGFGLTKREFGAQTIWRISGHFPKLKVVKPQGRSNFSRAKHTSCHLC